MIRSMTGFGCRRVTVGGKEIYAEIKSVNNRRMECSVRISRAYSAVEERIKPYLSARGIARGKIDVSVSVGADAENGVLVTLDEGYAKGYIAALRRLRDEFGLTDDISVMSVAANRELFLVSAPELDPDRMWEEVLAALGPAVDDFLNSREREGANLVRDIEEKFARIREIVNEIEARSEEDVRTYRQKLEERLRALLDDKGLSFDEGRILTECAIFADRVAVDEELVRLRSHLDAVPAILSSGEPVGRELDFLMQEMNREINTTGSKCSDAAIARLVVTVKNELEKIREQIQNLE